MCLLLCFSSLYAGNKKWDLNLCQTVIVYLVSLSKNSSLLSQLHSCFLTFRPVGEVSSYNRCTTLQCSRRVLSYLCVQCLLFLKEYLWPWLDSTLIHTAAATSDSAVICLGHWHELHYSLMLFTAHIILHKNTLWPLHIIKHQMTQTKTAVQPL